ncbi:hypothetical protein F5Y08DRAFT_300941 [Xylaria arbuscula]|nr:hypothetical protein F5Y08DRAFT_300941 [Xylaria arbuscula]
MDPITALGAAGSVVGIAGFGVQLAQILRKYLSQIWYAQESLEAIVEQIGITTSALEEIYVFLEQEVANIKRGQALYLFSGNSLEKVKETADKCLVIFWRVEATISGNWPAGIETQLVKRLVEFNNQLAHYSPETTITIELELNSDLLGLRDKLRWPNKASKLDKYCKQLQIYQDSLVLLLQIVSLGQQRLKPNPTERDARLMLRTYAIIGNLASPQDLQIIAWETQTRSQTRPGTAGREPSVAPSRFKELRASSQPTDDKLRTARGPARSVSRGFGNARSRPIDIDVLPTTKPQSSRNGIITNGHVISSDFDTRKQQPAPTGSAQAHKPLVRFSSSIDDTTQQGDEMDSVSRPNCNDQPLTSGHGTVDGGIKTTTSPPPPRAQAQVDNPAPKEHTADSKEMNGDNEQVMRQTTAMTPVNPSQGARDKQSQDKKSPENSNVGNAFVRNAGQKEVQILPYVLYEGGAYQLPVSLGLEMESKVQGTLNSLHSQKELTERSAFLNPGQVQTLQNILRDNPGDQARKLAHLEVLKKSSMRFWRRPTKVMIAFIEGETANMPQVVSLPSAGIANEHLKMPQTTILAVPQQQIPSREKFTTNSQKQDINQQKSMSNSQTLLQAFSLPSNSRVSGISGIQDVTALLLETAEWRERFTEYKVWTIRPFSSIEQTDVSSINWDRCVISEEHLSNTEVGRRLAALDKNPMTILEKIATLAVSQQIQVQQSLEAAKSNAYDPARQWKFRQLDIIRSKKWFKPRHVKRVVVYACIELLPPAPERPEESQKDHAIMDNGAFAKRRANSIQAASSDTKILSIEDKKHHHHHHGSSGEMMTTDSDSSSLEDSKREPINKKSRIHMSERRLDTIRDDAYRRGRAERQREVELANAAIASRPAGSPRPRLSTTRTYDSVGSLHSNPPGPVIINNHIYNYSDSEISGSDEYSEQDNYPSALVATGHQSTTNRTRDRLRREHEWIQRNFSPRSRSSSPRYRGRSVASSRRTSRARPRLLGFHTSDELRARTRSQARAGETYPDEFDKEPYDPQLSPQEDEARQEAIEQLLLEWTPLYKADKDSDSEEVDADESKEQEPASMLPNEQMSSPGTAMDEPELLHSAVNQAVESAADMQSDIHPGVEESIIKGITPGFNTENEKLRAESFSPYVGVGASYGEQQPRPLQKGGRAATLPTPARQAWTDPDWARHIVEETATVVDPDDYELPLRSPTAPRERQEGHQQGSAFPRADRERAPERYTSPTTRHHRDRSRVEHSVRDDLEQRPTPPRRRRTVEFEGLDRPAVSRGRDRDTDLAEDRRSYVSESRSQPRPRSRMRDRAPHSEAHVDQERRDRSRSRNYRHPPRR